MAKKATTRKPLHGNKRSHALNTTKKVQKLNMQTVIVNGEKVKMSTREAKKARKGIISEKEVQE